MVRNENMYAPPLKGCTITQYRRYIYDHCTRNCTHTCVYIAHVFKVFEQQNCQLKWYCGYICDYNDKEGYYEVKYKDNDIAIYKMKKRPKQDYYTNKPSNDNLIQEMAATSYSRIEAQYAKTTTMYSFTTQSIYGWLGGWAKAMLMIEANTYDICQQSYKYANIVVDYKTGNIMNLEELPKHPKYVDTWTKAVEDKYKR